MKQTFKRWFRKEMQVNFLGINYFVKGKAIRVTEEAGLYFTFNT